jgi:hypothetical protein
VLKDIETGQSRRMGSVTFSCKTISSAPSKISSNAANPSFLKISSLVGHSVLNGSHLVTQPRYVTFEDGRSLAEAIEEMHETVMCNLRIHPVYAQYITTLK